MDELYLFYAENNPLAASNIHNAILDEVERLQKHPQLGAFENALSNRSKQYRWNCKQNPKKPQEQLP